MRTFQTAAIPSTYLKQNQTPKSPSKLKAPWEFQLKTCRARREPITLHLFLCRLSLDPTQCFGTWAQIWYIRYPRRTIPMAFRLQTHNLLYQGGIHLHTDTWTAMLLGLIYCHPYLYLGRWRALLFRLILRIRHYLRSSWILTVLL